MSNSDNEVSIKRDLINERQVNDQLRCSVCHEDFRLSEAVSRLVCDHVFHECCITPWLQRRDTCPVCRRVLRGSPETDTDSDDDLFADDEDGDTAVEEEIANVVADADGLVTVSVQYRSTVEQVSAANVSSRSSVYSFLSDSESEPSDVLEDFFNSPSTTSDDSNVDILNTSFELSGNLETLSDCENSHVCFLEFDDSNDTDASDNMDVDFNLGSDDLNFSFSSNCFDNTIDPNMDIDQDFI